jgi:hypothetical protein
MTRSPSVNRPPWHVDRCAYCRKARAVNRDHVIPKSLRKRLGEVPAHLLLTVPACFACNIRKGQRHLVPPSWAGLVDELNEVVGGAEWRVWDGDVRSEAFTAVHR